MIDLPVHEQFRLARTARGESIEAVARRTGIRVEWVQAMDEGRSATCRRDLCTGQRPNVRRST